MSRTYLNNYVLPWAATCNSRHRLMCSMSIILMIFRRRSSPPFRFAARFSPELGANDNLLLLKYPTATVQLLLLFFCPSVILDAPPFFIKVKVNLNVWTVLGLLLARGVSENGILPFVLKASFHFSQVFFSYNTKNPFKISIKQQLKVSK